MITIRRSNERGHFDHGWLDTYHTFSFGDYRDARHMGFRVLRVINEDWVHPGQGFGMHPHRDMEIITYVLSGRLEHRDSLGNGAVIQPGRVQYMAAGSGILHSEHNPSPSEPVHLMQIWIVPDKKGLPPRYEDREFPQARNVDAAGGFTLLASGDGRDGSICINQDASLLAATLRDGQEVTHMLANDRHGWVQVLHGSIELGGATASTQTLHTGDATASTQTLHAGDAAAISDEARIAIKAAGDAEVLAFDLP